MPINYGLPAEYQYDFYYGGADIVLSAPSNLALTNININPMDLLGFQRKGEFVSIPESQGELYISDGYQRGVDMELFGGAAGDDPNDTFVTLIANLSRFVHGGGYKYLRQGLFNGTSKIFYRRYVESVEGGASIRRKTRYTAVDGLGVVLHAYDPSWYQDGIKLFQFAVVNGTTGNVVTSDTGDWHSQRALIYITRTASGTGLTPTNPTLSNSAGQSLTITGTLPAVADYWVVDMLNGSVVKHAGGVDTNAMDKFSGQFFPVQRTTDTITCVSTTSGSYTVSIVYLPRMS